MEYNNKNLTSISDLTPEHQVMVLHVIDDIRTGLYKKEDLKVSFFNKFADYSESFFYKTAKIAFHFHQKRRAESDKQKQDLYDKLEQEALERKIKSKLEREAELEEAKQQGFNLLMSLKTRDVIINKGTPKQYERDLTPMEIATLQNAMVRVDSELSQMRGDYAPKRIDQNTTLVGAEAEGLTVKIVDSDGNIK